VAAVTDEFTVFNDRFSSDQDRLRREAVLSVIIPVPAEVVNVDATRVATVLFYDTGCSRDFDDESFAHS
jgi:hypothetical protein